MIFEEKDYKSKEGFENKLKELYKLRNDFNFWMNKEKGIIKDLKIIYKINITHIESDIIKLIKLRIDNMEIDEESIF